MVEISSIVVERVRLSDLSVAIKMDGDDLKTAAINEAARKNHCKKIWSPIRYHISGKCITSHIFSFTKKRDKENFVIEVQKLSCSA